MADKMYVKDFVEALDKVGFDFDVWGFEGILNVLGIYSRYQVERYRKDAKSKNDLDYEILANWENARAEKIHTLLEERGYYNDKCN